LLVKLKERGDAMDNGRLSRSCQGFTLMELMITITIIAILAATAIPAFNNYKQKAHAQEAVDFLGIIKLRQESYRAEFGQYCNVNSANPATMPVDGNSVAWDSASANWLQLGASPGNSSVMFQYNVVAGTAGSTPPNGNPWGLPTTDFWYVATALGDLDDDGTLVTFDAIPGRKLIWCSSDKGWE
jgi:prepilin-type N-terminal cleavage/methylation domain-containing protein